MDRRTFLKTVLVGGGLTTLASDGYALKLFPRPGQAEMGYSFRIEIRQHEGCVPLDLGRIGRNCRCI